MNKPRSVGVTHAMEPVLPGRYAVITVGGCTDTTQLYARRLADGAPGRPLTRHPATWTDASPAQAWPIAQRKDECLTLDIPAGEFGVMAVSTNPDAPPADCTLINRPRLDWLLPAQATVGEPLRVIGRNLVHPGHYPQSNPDRPTSYGGLLQHKTRLIARSLDGDITRITVERSSAYEIHALIPGSLPPGEYDLFAHHGLGGRHGWSDPVRVTVAAADPWPTRVFDLDTYRREAKGDVDAAFEKALADIRAHGGGVLQLAADTYPVTRTIELPPRTLLRGAGRDRTLISCADNHGPKPPWVLITGDRDFIIEDLRLYTVYAAKSIIAPAFRPDTFQAAYGSGFTWSPLRARNVSVRRCRIEQRPNANLPRRVDHDAEYRRWLADWTTKSDAQDHRGFTAIYIKGDGIVIEDCDIWGGGSCVILPGCSHARLSRNTLRAGVSGHGFYAMGKIFWPDDWATNPNAVGPTITGNYSSQIILEDNTVTAYSDRARDLVYFIYGCEDCHVARNTIRDIQTNNDCEGLAFHLWSAKWAMPRVRMTGPTAGRIIDPENEVKRENLVGAVLEVLDGRGTGQNRTVLSRTGDVFEIDRPFAVDPDESSVICFSAPPPFRRMNLVDNDVANTGANMLIWGNTNDVILDGNSSSDNGHITIWSIRLAADQKVWGGAAFTQIIHNVSSNAWIVPPDPNSALDFFGGVISNPCSRHHDALQIGYDILGLVIRDNLIRDNSGIIFRRTFPGRGEDGKPTDWTIDDAGIVVENNTVRDSRIGVVIEKGSHALERGTSAHNTTWPVTWAPAVRSSLAVFNEHRE